MTKNIISKRELMRIPGKSVVQKYRSKSAEFGNKHRGSFV
jgi:hypothetical protein